jgi:hypothetical protein
MNVGFKEDSIIRTPKEILELKDIKENYNILTLNDLKNFDNSFLLSKEHFIANRCLKISLSNNTELICSEFVSIYSITSQKFIPAYGLKKGTVVKGYEENLIVAGISIVFNVNCIKLHFQEKPIYFINDILCHTYKDYSDYEFSLIQKNLLQESDMNQIQKMIYPSREKFTIQVKFSGSKWRDGSFLLDHNFQKDSTGYIFNKNIEIQICIEKTKINNCYLFINCFSNKNVKSIPKEDFKYLNNSGQWFFIYDLNRFTNDKETLVLNFSFQSEEEATLNNCVILNNTEYKRIIDYFQGLLVPN